MVNRQKQDSGRQAANQGVRDVLPKPNKINASTPYDFHGKNLTPYGGLLPVIAMVEKLGFQSLVEQTVTSKRIPRSMDLYRFVLGIVLGLIGFPRLNQLRFIARDPILTGILEITKLPLIHLLEVCERAAPPCRKADSDDYADHAGTGLGGGQRETGGRHHRHRHHSAYAVWTTNGWTQGLQPEEQGQELSADADVYR